MYVSFKPLLGCVLLAAACVSVATADDRTSTRKLRAAMTKLRDLHRPLGRPQPGDWLAHHQEPGQTFAQYLRARPVTPTGDRKVIYIQPIGEFTDAQRKVVRLTADYMGRYFTRPVKINKDLPLSIIPAKARRTHPTWKVKQILSTYVLREVLPPRLPRDGAVLIAFTSSDLWPGEGWNFVFGQAMLRQRVGVWSIYRKGDPDQGEAAFRLCLLRTMKTAVHETGHMFSMLHCTGHQCVMCGSNSLAESDRHPLAACVECMAKTCWATGADPATRYRALAEFCDTHGLKPQAKFFQKSVRRLAGKG